MAKPRIPNQKKQYQLLNRRLAAYMAAVRRIYGELNSEAARIALSTGYDGKQPFAWKDYPATKARVRKLQERFVSQLGGLIMTGTSDEWKRSNLQQDLIVDKVLKAYHTSREDAANERYYRDNSEALQAFQTRKEQGMNLSDKLWDQSQAYREELQDTISAAIERGTDAITLSKQISKYLSDFPAMQRDYKEKYGKASKVQNCEYRSIRLARSEINMAYRSAEQTRWRQLDFVVGYEIKMSGSHPVHDVCDELAGKYPKDFVWNGWHPNCMCYEIPILKTEEEFYSDDDKPSVNEVTDVPEEFNTWVGQNTERIRTAESHGTLPYFLADNGQYLAKAQEEYKEWELFTNIIDVYSYAGRVDTDTLRMIDMDLRDIYSVPIIENSKRVAYLQKYEKEMQEHLERPNIGKNTKLAYEIQLEQIRKKIAQELEEIKADEFRKELLQRGFNDVSYARYQKSSLRGFDMIAFDDKLIEIGDEYHIYWKSREISGHTFASFTFTGEAESGGEVKLMRAFSPDGRGIKVEHQIFRLPKELQGKGISKKIMRACFEEYENMGVTRVDVTANMDVGGLTWAKYGFYCERRDIEAIINKRYSEHAITREEALDALAIVREYEEYVPMQLLGYSEYGERLLKGESWHGHIDLKDEVQMNYLHKYLHMSE